MIDWRTFWTVVAAIIAAGLIMGVIGKGRRS